MSPILNADEVGQPKIPVTCQLSHGHLKHRAVCHNEPDKLPAVRTAQGDGLRVKIFAIHVQGRQRCDQVRSLQLAVCYIRICETEATDPNVGTPAAGETPKSALLSEPCCSTKQEQPLCFTLAVCRPTHLIFSAGLLRPHIGRGRVRER